ncbi:MAG: methyltransferase, FxLD system [Sciscionella sp.]
MTTTTPNDAQHMHERMVQQIIATGAARSEAVIAALRAVPRHLFLPNATLDEAYNPNIAVITKYADDGTHLSCASVATLVAGMLEHLDVQPGNRVLEIGAGTGFNAALLAELAAPDGAVTTVDIDEEVTEGAAAALDATGYRDVRVLTRDGALGANEDAPFDRLIVTVGAWDLPGAWFTQLKAGGRMVVPLRWRGQTRGVSFVLGEDGVLRSEAVFLCGFVPMIGQHGERTATIHAHPAVRIHYDIDQQIDPDALTGTLEAVKNAAWSGVTIGPNDPFDGIWLRATATDPTGCRIEATTDAVSAGICTPVIPNLSPALVADTSLAYLAHRRHNGPESRYELGAIGHGPHGTELAERLCEHIRTWDTDRAAMPTITANRKPRPQPPEPADTTVVKTHSAITIVY